MNPKTNKPDNLEASEWQQGESILILAPYTSKPVGLLHEPNKALADAILSNSALFNVTWE